MRRAVEINLIDKYRPWGRGRHNILGTQGSCSLLWAFFLVTLGVPTCLPPPPPLSHGPHPGLPHPGQPARSQAGMRPRNLKIHSALWTNWLGMVPCFGKHQQIDLGKKHKIRKGEGILTHWADVFWGEPLCTDVTLQTHAMAWHIWKYLFCLRHLRCFLERKNSN